MDKWEELRRELTNVATWIEVVEDNGKKRIPNRNSALVDLLMKMVLMMLPSYPVDYDDDTDFYSDGNKILCKNEADLAFMTDILQTLCKGFNDDKEFLCGLSDQSGFYYIELGKKEA